jgi:hypothetical protein
MPRLTIEQAIVGTESLWGRIVDPERSSKAWERSRKDALWRKQAVVISSCSSLSALEQTVQHLQSILP